MEVLDHLGSSSELDWSAEQGDVRVAQFGNTRFLVRIKNKSNGRVTVEYGGAEQTIEKKSWFDCVATTINIKAIGGEPFGTYQILYGPLP